MQTDAPCKHHPLQKAPGLQEPHLNTHPSRPTTLFWGGGPLACQGGGVAIIKLELAMHPPHTSGMPAPVTQWLKQCVKSPRRYTPAGEAAVLHTGGIASKPHTITIQQCTRLPGFPSRMGRG